MLTILSARMQKKNCQFFIQQFFHNFLYSILTAFPKYGCSIYKHCFRYHSPPKHPLLQQIQCRFAQQRNINPKGRQRWGHILRNIYIINTKYCRFLWYLYPSFIKSLKHADCQCIAGNTERGRQMSLFYNFLPNPISLFHRKLFHNINIR